MNTELLTHLNTLSLNMLAAAARDEYKRVCGVRPHHWDADKLSSRDFLTKKICELVECETVV